MMAELAPLWGKFGNPSGQVRLRNCPGLLFESVWSKFSFFSYSIFFAIFLDRIEEKTPRHQKK